MDKIVVERRDGLSFRGGTAGTGTAFLTVCRTGRVRSLFPISPTVPRGILSDIFAANLVTTDGTADHFIIATGSGTGSIDFILVNRRCRNMPAGDSYLVCTQLCCALTVAEGFAAA